MFGLVGFVLNVVGKINVVDFLEVILYVLTLL
jgi:hypothetical protein